MPLIPAAPAPANSRPDLQHPQVADLQAGLSVAFIGIGISTAFILLRFYIKATAVKIFAVEDVCIIASWALAIALQTIFIWLRFTDHIGVHMWDLSVSKANLSILLTGIASIIYVPLIGFAKIPLLLFYRTLSNVQWFKTAVWITIAILVSYSLAAIFALVFACTPMEKNWNITVKEGQCINRGAVYVATASVNAATNLALLVLPIPIILRTKFSRREKVGLASAFGTGTLAFISSCVELALLPTLLTSKDVTRDISIPAIWMSTEASLLVVCGCLPTLRRYFVHVPPQLTVEPMQLKSSASDGADGQLVFRHRPVSQLTAFNGRIMKKQQWERHHKRGSSHNVISLLA